jgi:hypothetical protein
MLDKRNRERRPRTIAAIRQLHRAGANCWSFCSLHNKVRKRWN